MTSPVQRARAVPREDPLSPVLVTFAIFAMFAIFANFKLFKLFKPVELFAPALPH